MDMELFSPDVNSNITLQIAGKFSNFSEIMGKPETPMLSSMSLDLPLTPAPDFPTFDLDQTKDGPGFVLQSGVFPCQDDEEEGGIGNIENVPELADEPFADFAPSSTMTPPTSPPTSPNVPAINGFFPQITTEENELSNSQLFSALTDCQGKQKRCLEASEQALADEDEAWIQQLLAKTPKGSVLLIWFRPHAHGLDPMVTVVPERDPDALSQRSSIELPSMEASLAKTKRGMRDPATQSKRKGKQSTRKGKVTEGKGTVREKKFICDKCGVGLGTEFSRKRHLKTHSGVKNLVCTFNSDCKRKFSEKSALKRHLQSHTKARPFVCPNCSRPYADRVNLHKHLASQTCNVIPISRKKKRPAH